MGDGFQADLEQIARVAGVFEQEHEAPSRLSAALLNADRADTGDASLNEQIRGVVELFDKVLTTLTDVVAADAEGLNQTVADYQSVDTDAATNLDQVHGQVGYGGAPSAAIPATGNGSPTSRIQHALG
jgi:Family of unknown function (DUF6317)